MILGIWWVWWLLVGLICALIWFVYSAIEEGKTPDGQKRIQEYNARKIRISNPPEGFARETAFIGPNGRIAIDVSGKRLAIGAPDGWTEFDFKDVREAELDIEGVQVTRTSSSRSLLGAAVGGLAFGPAGAVIGGLGGKTTSETIKRIGQVTLKVHVRDMERPIRKIRFRHLGAIDAQLSDANEAVKYGTDWLSRIQLIVEDNDR